MPELETNAKVWQSEYDWRDRGEEWSAWWGDSEALWHGAIMPRIHPLLPAGTILEIAPGFGRWTRYLKDHCEHLVLVDMTDRCIEHCKSRFSAESHIDYHVNDGRSLAMIADGTIDLAFSFDSLVHAEIDILRAYLTQLGAKLHPDGAAFLHHSNLAAHRPIVDLTHRLPARIRAPLIRRGWLVDLSAWRARSVGAELVAEACERAGLACVSQETIRWERGRMTTDALTLVTRPGSRWDRKLRRDANHDFQREADRIKRLWARAGFEANHGQRRSPE